MFIFILLITFCIYGAPPQKLINATYRRFKYINHYFLEITFQIIVTVDMKRSPFRFLPPDSSAVRVGQVSCASISWRKEDSKWRQLNKKVPQKNLSERGMHMYLIRKNWSTHSQSVSLASRGALGSLMHC